MKINIFLLIALLNIPVASWASGVGFYGIGGAGKGSWSGYGMGESWITHTGMDASYGDSNTSTTLYGGGLIWDSAAAKDTLFNYRLKVGYERSFMHILSANTKSRVDPTNRYGMSHTFGLGVLRTENIRFWIGPQIGFHYFRVKEIIESSPYDFLLYSMLSFPTPLPSYLTLLLLQKQTLEYDFVGGDILLALGVNFNLGDYTTLFLEMGVGYMGIYSLKYDIIGHNVGIQAHAGIMFRIGDKYQTEEIKKIENK